MNHARIIRILAISGSLRRASSNSALVEAAARLAPGTVEMSIYSGLAELPAFNPDLDDDANEAVTRFRDANGFVENAELSTALRLAIEALAAATRDVLIVRQ